MVCSHLSGSRDAVILLGVAWLCVAVCTATEGTRTMFDVSLRGTGDRDLDLALKLLDGIGVTHLVAVNLSLPELDIPVVKVVVPGLEGACEGPETDYVPGKRAQQLLENTG